MKLIHFASAIAALALLGACATATPYQAAQDSSRGYAEQKVETNRWMVSFSGNSLTDRQTVETYLLYRAAELTSLEGYDNFRVLKRETDETKRYYSAGYYDPFYSHFFYDFAYYGHRGRYYPTYYNRSRRFSRFGHRGAFHRSAFGHGFGGFGYDNSVREIVRYEATAEIIMSKGEKPDDPAFFDATEVLTNLAGNIARPETRS